MADHGEGIPVVMWPSLFSDHRFFALVVEELGDGWRTIRVDGPGFGESDAPKGTEQAGDYTVTGTVDMSTLVLVGVIAFALSMDYEVFMLSRITEEHAAGRDTTDAVAFGLQRTGRIITAAAVLIAIVFASFMTSGATNIKQLGLGVTVAILLDATIVRALLVPAFMRIAGKANWWAPSWLRKVHQRVGLQDG